jgi:hypothetical protein
LKPNFPDRELENLGGQIGLFLQGSHVISQALWPWVPLRLLVRLAIRLGAKENEETRVEWDMFDNRYQRILNMW